MAPVVVRHFTNKRGDLWRVVRNRCRMLGGLSTGFADCRRAPTLRGGGPCSNIHRDYALSSVPAWPQKGALPRKSIQRLPQKSALSLGADLKRDPCRSTNFGTEVPMDGVSTQHMAARSIEWTRNG